jgi:Tol biopolymer transport system component
LIKLAYSLPLPIIFFREKWANEWTFNKGKRYYPKHRPMKNLILFLLFIPLFAMAQLPDRFESELVLLEVKSGKQVTILREERHFEAPNWSRDGSFLLINSEGLLEKVAVSGEKLGPVPTGFATECNNDHGYSFDGKTLIISLNDASVGTGANSRIFALPADGGTPRLVTERWPSYWHGISPDGENLVYCAFRDDNWDVYRIGINGGPETRLTDSPGLDDGPEYSYDGQWIYFNSHRTGRMHLYRMGPDGSGQEQLTFDEFDNWFAHPSPDGKYVAYIAYLTDQKGQHPFGQDVKIRLMNVKTRKVRDLTPVFYGGQGSLNVPSWSPDGKYIAFVRYHKL